MDERSTVQTPVRAMLGATGALAISTVDFSYAKRNGVKGGESSNPKDAASMPSKGMADIWASFHDPLSPAFGATAFIEAKIGKESWSFSEWRDDQRNWAKTWAHVGRYWLAIGMGVKRPHTNDIEARRIFLIPGEEVLLTEQMMEEVAGLKSIPFIAAYTNRKAVAQYNLSAVNLWSKWVLDWNGGWCVPSHHPFYTIYIENSIPFTVGRGLAIDQAA